MTVGGELAGSPLLEYTFDSTVCGLWEVADVLSASCYIYCE